MLTPDTSAHKISRMIVVTTLIILSMITTALVTLDLNTKDNEILPGQGFTTAKKTLPLDSDKMDISSSTSTHSLISGLNLGASQQAQD